MVALDGLKRWLVCALTACVTLGAHGEDGDARERSCANLRVEVLATAQIPANVQGVGRVGGLSGLLWTSGGEFLAVSDGVPETRLYRLAIDLKKKGEGVGFSLGVAVDRPIELRCDSSDAEALVGIETAERGGQDGALLVGFESPVGVKRFAAMELRRGAEALGCIDRLSIPEEIVTGVRKNRAIESMVWLGSGRGWGSAERGDRLWVAMEAALVGDGEEATEEAGSLCRVLEYGWGEGGGVVLELRRQMFYETEAAPKRVAGLRTFNSLSEMCGLPDGRVLVLERSFGLPWGWGAELFVCDGSVEEREGVALPVLKKERVGSLREMGVVLMGNLEGMAVGGTVAEMVGDESDRGLVLVLVADDNFGRDGQVGSQVIVCRIEPVEGE